MNSARALAAWPLWVRLVALITAMIAVGLVVAGLVSSALLGRVLRGLVDEKLEAEGKATAQQTLHTLTTGNDENLPSDYYVQVVVDGVDGYATPYAWGSSRVTDLYGTPDLPSMTATQAAEVAGVPFTVHASTGDVSWRVVAYPFSTGTGLVMVALPLADADRAGASMARVLVVSGLVIVLVGGLTGGIAVRRQLRPLREMEHTAAAIAAGDLSQRVPQAPTGTEVGRLGSALNGMLTQIEQAFAARTASEARMRRFVADASHELRTPLATIRGYAELYRMGALPTTAAVDDTMGRIEGSATRMGALVEDLLALARLDEGRPLDVGAVDLVVLAGDAAVDLSALDRGRAVRVTGLDGGPVRSTVVAGDEARLRQVLVNLIGNVVRHTPAGSPVELAVGTSPDGTAGVLEVRDHGPGIAPEHAARVFERFYRVDSSRTRDSGGAGLGMAIVAAIVAAHHGTVAIDSTPGGGATVRLAVPLVG